MMMGTTNPLAKMMPTPVSQNLGFQNVRAQFNLDANGSPKKPEPLAALEKPLEKVRASLLDPASPVNRFAHLTGKDRYLSVFVALSDTLVKIYRTLLNQRPIMRLPEPTVGGKPFPAGGIIA